MPYRTGILKRLLENDMEGGQHIHKWQYSEPRQVTIMGKGSRQEWWVLRFCTAENCLEVEDKQLKHND